MSLKSIASRDNPEYKRILGLAEDARVRRSSGHTLLDGEHLLEEALHAGISIECLILERGASRAAAWLERYPGLRAVELAPALFHALSPVATPSGLLAEIAIPGPRLTQCNSVLLLEAIQDPGNLGAIVRTAAAAGVGQILLSNGCADAWSPKVLRGGQGGHFRLDLHTGADLAAWLRTLPGPAYAALPRAETSLFGLDLTGPVAFVFGNEGTGLSPELARLCRAFAIPMAGGVESLNVAASVAVCLYERFRQTLT